MQSSREFIEEYKQIHKKVSRENLSNEEDYERASNLIGFFDLLLKIDIRNNPEKYMKGIRK